MTISTNNGGWNDHNANTDAPVGAWTYLSAAYDGAGTLDFYFDGASDGSVAYTIPSAVAGSRQLIGAAESAPVFLMDGHLDELRLSDTARSASSRERGDWRRPSPDDGPLGWGGVLCTASTARSTSSATVGCSIDCCVVA